jgi:stearoyl-CoA desaturase (Delta-9 desaturase)
VKEISGNVQWLSQRIDYPALILFSMITLATVIGVPIFGFLHGFSTLDWIMFGILYMASGLGITVGY